MKKFIYSLILILLLIPGLNVNADECVNLLNPELATWNYYSDIKYYYYSEDSEKLYNYQIPVDASTTYTLFIADGTPIYSVTQIIGPSNFLVNSTTTVDFLTFTTSWNTSYITFATKGYYATSFSTLDFWLVKGDSVCQPTETETPDEPIVADTTLDNFYSIYLDKLTLLANYASENKFFLGAIGVILAFISLELLFDLFFIKDRRRF